MISPRSAGRRSSEAWAVNGDSNTRAKRPRAFFGTRACLLAFGMATSAQESRSIDSILSFVVIWLWCPRACLRPYGLKMLWPFLSPFPLPSCQYLPRSLCPPMLILLHAVLFDFPLHSRYNPRAPPLRKQPNHPKKSIGFSRSPPRPPRPRPQRAGPATPRRPPRRGPAPPAARPAPTTSCTRPRPGGPPPPLRTD